MKDICSSNLYEFISNSLEDNLRIILVRVSIIFEKYYIFIKKIYSIIMYKELMYIEINIF